MNFDRPARMSSRETIEPLDKVPVFLAEEGPFPMFARRPMVRRGAPTRSVSHEDRLALGRESLEGSTEIAGRHADRLGLCFGLDHLVYAH
jgi:hypothetical protein